jgi:hypothetical protein
LGLIGIDARKESSRQLPWTLSLGMARHLIALTLVELAVELGEASSNGRDDV